MSGPSKIEVITASDYSPEKTSEKHVFLAGDLQRSQKTPFFRDTRIEWIVCRYESGDDGLPHWHETVTEYEIIISLQEGKGFHYSPNSMRKSLLALALGAIVFNSFAASAREAAPLEATRAELLTPSGPVVLSGSDGLFDRVFIAEKDTVSLRVTIPDLLANREISIAASNGGRLVRRDGKLRFTPEKTGPVALDLEFTPTLGRGTYTITIRQAGSLVTLDLWAGKPNPIGHPGPAYVPVRPTETESPSVSASPLLGQD